MEYVVVLTDIVFTFGRCTLRGRHRVKSLVGLAAELKNELRSRKKRQNDLSTFAIRSR